MGLILSASVDGWPAVIDRVLYRDGRCIFGDVGPIIRIGASVLRSPFLDHFCRDRNRAPIEWWRLRGSIAMLHQRGAVELDHVKEPMLVGAPVVHRTDRHSYKAPDDEAHLVVACHGAHHGGLATSHEGRQFEREWLAALYPEVWQAFLRNAAETPDSGADTSL